MTRMTKSDAFDLCASFGIATDDLDWHRMNTDQKERVLSAADFRRYRKPANANGSRGRCFADYLRRVIEGGRA